MLDKYKRFWDNVPPELDPRLHPFGKRRVPTNNDWCPNFEDNTVEVGVSILTSGEIRVHVWGNDDTGMVLDMPINLPDYYMWNAWVSQLSFIDMNTLLGLGFEFF